jgi:putative exosortase-associated protein (TIGR04073 family)
MRSSLIILPLFMLLVTVSPLRAETGPPSDIIVEHMAVKLVRGITNIVTCVVELPKQTYLTVKKEGATGYLIGPIKGLGMTVYRAFMGAGETVLFLVPQPGYYEPMIDPDYVWKGWNIQEKAGTRE